jgi:integrase/recombinase XerD
MEVTNTNDVLINKFLRFLEEQGQGSGVIAGYSMVLKEWAEFMASRDCYVSDVTVQDVNDFGKLMKEKGKTEKTIYRKLRSLGQFYRISYEQGWIHEEKEPVILESTAYAEAMPRPLTIDELKRLIHACSDVKTRALFTFMYETGLRTEEVIRLHKEDINWEDLYIIVKNKQGEKDRLVFFQRKLKDLLKKYLRTRKDKLPLLFADEKSPLNRAKMQVTFADICKKAGIVGHVGLSSLRRSLATHMIEQGIDLGHIAQILGLPNTKSLEPLVPAEGVRTNEYQKFISAMDL